MSKIRIARILYSCAKTASVADFFIKCEECGFGHAAGDTVSLYDYELFRDDKKIEDGSFQILHDDHIKDAQRYKYCIVCGALKPLEHFDRHSARASGRQGGMHAVQAGLQQHQEPDAPSRTTPRSQPEAPSLYPIRATLEAGYQGNL